MLKTIINTDKIEITIGMTNHITSWYFKCALPFDIDFTWTNDVKNNRCFNLSIDFLCFRFYIEIWRWHNKD